MDATSLGVIARTVEVNLPAQVPADLQIKGIAYDSRQVKPGFLFLAIPGKRRDGTVFIDEALKRGAVAVVGEQPLAFRHVPYLRVANARLAMARIACEYFGKPSTALEMFGVTGTNGKTTTAFMLKAIFSGQGRHCGLISTVRYEIGERMIPAHRTTPEAPDLQAMLQQMDRAGCDAVAMEVSSHALDQYRVAGIDFDAAIFTNLSRDHLDYHLDMDCYCEAKKTLFRELGCGRKSAVAILNADDPRVQEFVQAVHSDRVRTWTYGFSPDADLRVTDVKADASGSRVTLASPWGAATLMLRQLGRFNVMNALAALCAGAARGMDLQSMADALAEMPPVPGRLERVTDLQHPFQVFVDYAHTDDALRHVLPVLREATNGRLRVVMGCGGDRDEAKRPLMGAAAADLADETWITSDNPRSEDPAQIAAAVAAGFGDRATYRIELDRAAAIQGALAAASAGDTVLIAGKGHETYQEFAHTVIPFDDAVIARKAMGMVG